MKRQAILGVLAICVAISWVPSGEVWSAADPAFRGVAQSQPPIPIRQFQGLLSLTFWERTGPQPIGNTFPANAPQLGTRLNNLDFGSRDFTGAGQEFYDVFYSDADGSANQDGAYVTIEAVWNFALPNGGGLNIAEVQLNFVPGRAPAFGNAVTSYVGLGDNFIAASVPLAVDGDLQTHTAMGNTLGQSQRLRITIGFSSAPTCEYSITPTQQTFPGTGGTGTIDITAPQGCLWSASVSPSSPINFIALTSAVSGSGNGSVSYSVSSGLSTGPRSGTIQLHYGGRNGPVVRGLTVTQEDPGCPASAYSIDPIGIDSDLVTFSSFRVFAPPGCSWRATTRDSWISFLSSFGTGDGDVVFLTNRAEGDFRAGAIYVAGKIFSIYQHDPNCPTEVVCFFFPGVCRRTSHNGLATARRFRDDVLSKTPRGQRYTQLYYRFAREAVQAMLLHPSLLLRSREIMQNYLPVVEAIVKGETPTLTKGDLEEIDSFLNAVAATGSADLRETIQELRRDIRDPQVQAEFRLTVTEGPKRAAPGGLPGIKTTGMIAPIGLMLLCMYAKKRRRRNTLAALNRLLSIAIVLTLAGIQCAEVGSPRPVSRQSERNLTSSSVEPIHSKTNLPFGFEANLGQTDPQVKYLSRANGYRLFLTPTDAVVELQSQKPGNKSRGPTHQLTTDGWLPTRPAAEHQPPAPDVLRMRLVGADTEPKITGVDPISATANYLIGNDRAKWRESVPAFSKVKYQDVYRGVDMFYYGNHGELEYDFIAAPGADPAAIGLVFDGADQIEIDASGDLVFRMSAGELRQRKPVAYQDIEGERREIRCRYIIRNPQSEIPDRVFGFEIGAYDSTRPLIIDPVLVYSTYLGGDGTDEGNSIAVDTAGNAYVVGFTNSLNYPINNSQSNFAGGQQDAFVAKLDPTGARVIYSVYVGGDGQDNGTGIAVDSAGNAYVTGYTGSTDFPVQNALQEATAGAFNSFVLKLSPTGSLLQSTLLGGSFSDYGSSIAVDAAGAIYVAGIATSLNFPMANAIQSTFGGSADVFVAKLNPAATRLVYSTYLGGAGVEGASSIAVDSGGNTYLTGLTSSPNFGTVNPLQPTHGGGIFDAFVTKLDPSGTQVLYSTYLGGGGVDRSLRIAVDALGSAYVVGDTDSIDFPVVNPAQQTSGGGSDAFVAKLNSSGTALAFSTYLGGSGIDGGTAIAVENAGSVYVTGFTNSANFPVVAPTQPAVRGAYDGFVARLNPSGAALDYSTWLGGSGIDSAFGIVVDAGGNAYVMGVTDSTDFPTASAFQASYGGGTADVFVARIKAGPAISRAEIQGKNLLVFGNGFDAGARILLEGEPQKTRNDEVTPAGVLFGKKVGKKIAQGTTVTLQVRNSDGTLSNQLSFARP